MVISLDIWYKVEVVQKMQDYIIRHINDNEFSFEELYNSVGYSQRQADRYFVELIGKTPKQYLKQLRLSYSASNLLKKNVSVLHTALDTSFKTNEGYSKAFYKNFGKLPSEYQKGNCLIPLSIYYPIKHYYHHILNKENVSMNPNYCLITPVHREKRKLILMYSQKATDYFSFCAEKSCDWEGLLNSNPIKMDTAAILELPDFLCKDGFGKIACGIEVPIDFNGTIPDGYETVELPECDMLYFQSPPYENEDDYSAMIDLVNDAISKFDCKLYDFEIRNDLAPRFNFGAQKEIGARYAIPINKLNK